MLGWPVLMLLQNIFASVYSLQTRQLAKKYPKAYFQILSGVFIVMYAGFLFYAIANWSDVSLATAWAYAPQIALTGLGFSVWSVLTFLTFKYVDAAIGTLFSTLNLIALVVVSSLTIHETLHGRHLIGAAILFAAIAIILLNHLTAARKHRWEIALAITLVASVIYGAAISSEKFLLDKIGMPTYSVFGVGVQTITTIIPALFYGRRHFKLYKLPDFTRDIILMGLVRVGGGLLFVASLVLADNASLVGSLSGLKIILTAFLAAWFLHETQFMRRKVIAACVAFVGVWLLVA